MGLLIPDAWLTSRQSFEVGCDSLVTAQARVLGEYTMFPDPKDKSITPHLVREGYWEAWVSLAVARYVKSGMYCVDGGANVGYYSLLMAGRGAARIMAVEPHPTTADLLRRTVGANDLDAIIAVEQVALGPVFGKAELMRYGDFHGSDSLLESKGYEVTDRVSVDVRPLDALVGRWERMDFVKMDVEGYEEGVWEGMQMIREYHPNMVVCMEVMLRPGWDAKAFLDRLASEKTLGIVEEDGSVSIVTPEEFLKHPLIVRHDGGMAWLS